MKKKLFLTIFGLLSLLITTTSNAQIIADNVSIQPGYTNQTYYNMGIGTLSSVSNTDWDLGFQLRGFPASIIINSKNNVHLYKANKDVSQWSTMTAADTAGLLNVPNELFNSDTSWDWGAFNITGDTSNAFDLGWGLYDPPSHFVIGDSLYFIKLANGSFKKLWIESLQTGTYFFRTADLDGSNEVLASLVKSNYAGKYFAYHSIVNNINIDREPVYNAWDLVFTQYLTHTPFTYKVAGVLSNDSVNVARAYPVDVITAGAYSAPYRYAINAIGFDWKTYDMNTNSWVIEDSLVYFIEARNKSVWKMIFTGFAGSATGTYYFTKELVGTVSVDEVASTQILSAYPNPAGNMVQVLINSNNASDQNYELVDVLGKVVQGSSLPTSIGFTNLNLNISSLNNGIYFLRIGNANQFSTQKIVVQH